MTDLGTHPTFLPAYFASSLSSLFDPHCVLPFTDGPILPNYPQVMPLCVLLLRVDCGLTTCGPSPPQARLLANYPVLINGRQCRAVRKILFLIAMPRKHSRRVFQYTAGVAALSTLHRKGSSEKAIAVCRGSVSSRALVEKVANGGRGTGSQDGNPSRDGGRMSLPASDHWRQPQRGTNRHLELSGLLRRGPNLFDHRAKFVAVFASHPQTRLFHGDCGIRWDRAG